MGLFPPLRPNFDAALRDAGSKDARSRAAAANALGAPPEGREDEAKRALRPLIDDAVAAVRSGAIESLGQLRDARAVDDIIARFDDGDPMVRQVAVMAAGALGDARAVSPLRRALRRDEPEVRFQALASLAAVAPAEAAEPLSRLARDPDLEVRAHLAEVLGSLEDPAAEEGLSVLLEDEVQEVRRSAAIALARIGVDTGATILIDTLTDRDRCFEAAWAIGELRVERAREPLARLASATFKPLASRAAAAAALVRLDDPRGAPALGRVLMAFRSDARGYAAQLVGELELVEFVPELVKLARRPRGADPMAIAEALAKLAPKSEEAKVALAMMAEREDEVGERARELGAPQAAEGSSST